MKKTIITLSITFILSFLLSAQSNSKPAYMIYKNSKPVSWNELVKEVSKANMVFFGEYHNNPIHHWLQIELTKELFDLKQGNITLGAEMFEADNQLILNEYLQGIIRERNFNDEARLWNNYQTDYRPLVEFAKENHIKFVATNVPRRYASMVNQGGFEALANLQAQAMKYMPPLPIPFDPELSTYKAMSEMMGMPGKQGASTNIVKAQALKDATMAWFIIQNWEKSLLFIHFNGAFHTDYKEGIIWYINHYASLSSSIENLKIVTISGEEQDDVYTPPMDNKADFIIVTPTSMTKTY
jgi:uncharacterized iron-regulated protein